MEVREDRNDASQSQSPKAALTKARTGGVSSHWGSSMRTLSHVGAPTAAPASQPPYAVELFDAQPTLAALDTERCLSLMTGDWHLKALGAGNLSDRVRASVVSVAALEAKFCKPRDALTPDPQMNSHVQRARFLTDPANAEILQALSTEEIGTLARELVDSNDLGHFELAVSLSKARQIFEPTNQGDSGRVERSVAMELVLDAAMCEVFARCAAIDLRLATECAELGVCDVTDVRARMINVWAPERYMTLVENRSVSMTTNLRDGDFKWLLCIFGSHSTCRL